MSNRFEYLSRHEQIKTLVRIHSKLNKELFNNELHKARPADTINPYIELSYYVFIAISDVERGAEACYYKGQVQKIYFQSEWLKSYMPLCKTIKRQKTHLVITMLHEMIHQYIDETQQYTGENDGHDAIFYREAKKRGLIDEGSENHAIEIDPNLARIAYSIQFYTKDNTKK